MRPSAEPVRRNGSVWVRGHAPPGSGGEVIQPPCFGGDEQAALGEDWLAEHAAAADREGLEDGSGGGVEQVGAGGTAGGAVVGASGEYPGAVQRGGAHYRAGQAGLPDVGAGRWVDLADRSAVAGAADGGGITADIQRASGPVPDRAGQTRIVRVGSGADRVCP